jgi:hypothetical protein
MGNEFKNSVLVEAAIARVKFNPDVTLGVGRSGKRRSLRLPLNLALNRGQILGLRGQEGLDDLMIRLEGIILEHDIKGRLGVLGGIERHSENPCVKTLVAIAKCQSRQPTAGAAAEGVEHQ